MNDFDLTLLNVPPNEEGYFKRCVEYALEIVKFELFDEEMAKQVEKMLSNMILRYRAKVTKFDTAAKQVEITFIHRDSDDLQEASSQELREHQGSVD